MKKLDATKLTDEQIEFFKTHLAYLSTVDKNGEPQIGPKQSMKVLDNGHLQYLEKTKAHAYENLKNGSKAAVVVADVHHTPTFVSRVLLTFTKMTITKRGSQLKAAHLLLTL